MRGQPLEGKYEVEITKIRCIQNQKAIPMASPYHKQRTSMAGGCIMGRGLQRQVETMGAYQLGE